jgi:hypothetical protein
MRQLPVLIAWENCTMSEFDWRLPETYARLQTAEAADFAREYRRRNSESREDYRTRPNMISGLMRGPASAFTD